MIANWREKMQTIIENRVDRDDEELLEMEETATAVESTSVELTTELERTAEPESTVEPESTPEPQSIAEPKLVTAMESDSERSFWGINFEDVLHQYRVTRRQYRDEDQDEACEKALSSKIIPMPKRVVEEIPHEEMPHEEMPREEKPHEKMPHEETLREELTVEIQTDKVFSQESMVHSVESEQQAAFKYRYIVGKIVGEDIHADDGKLLAKRNQPITEALISLVEAHGRLMDLIMEMQMPER